MQSYLDPNLDLSPHHTSTAVVDLILEVCRRHPDSSRIVVTLT
jgi:hypothetical protein